jgi:CRISPR-associated protein Csd1
MILQELHDLAVRERLVPDPDYELKPVAWLITVNKNGRLVGGIRGTHHLVQVNEKKTRKAIKLFSVPRCGGRSSGDKSFFFCDKADYVFGMSVEESEKTSAAEKLISRHKLFKDTVRLCAEQTCDDGAMAVLVFLENLASSGERVNLNNLPEKVTSSDLFAFIYEPDVDCLVTDRDLVREYWKKTRSLENSPVSGSDVSQCLVTGKYFYGSTLFPLIKKLPGGGTSGVGLVSFNANAFESYGWSGNQNAPISRDACEAIATALNRLIDNAPHDPNDPDRVLPTQNVRLSSDTIVCYWNRGESDFSANLRGLLESDPSQVEALYSSIWRGGKSALMQDYARFYAMTLSGTKGRAIVRDWFESTVSEVQSNLCKYFNDLALGFDDEADSANYPPIAMRVILESLAAPSKNRSESVPGHLASGMVHAALSGSLFPATALQSAVARYRCEIDKSNDPKDGPVTRMLNRARAAVIKAVLNRKRCVYPSESIKYEEVLAYMNPNCKDQGYLLGRLMAVLEKMQVEALRSEKLVANQEDGSEKEPRVEYQNINATIVDRFFSGASATPKAVFPRLLQNRPHYTKKLQDKGDAGRATIYNNYIGEILSNFDVTPKEGLPSAYNTGFPMFLNLNEQGLFVIGYHQMRYWLWMNRAELDKWEELNPDAPRVYKRNA